MLSLDVEMRVKVGEFIGKDVCVWYYIEIFLPELFLHFDYIVAQPVFSSELKTIWEVIDFLVLVQIVVDVRLKCLA